MYVLTDRLSRVFERRADVAFHVFCWYGLAYTLGNFGRLVYGKSSLGVTSFLMALLIVLRLPESLKAIWSNRFFQLWLAFIAYVGLSSALQQGAEFFSLTDGNLRELLVLGAYLIFSASVYSLAWTPQKVYVSATFLVSGLSLMALLFVLDNSGLVDVPRMNDLPPGFDRSAIWPYAQFGHRSLMAVYTAPLLTFLLVMSESMEAARWFRACALLVSAVYMYVLLWSVNRSGPAAILAALGVYYCLNMVVHRRMFSKMVPDFVLPITLAVAAALFVPPYLFTTYYDRVVSTPVVKTILPAPVELWPSKADEECINLRMVGCVLGSQEEHAIYKADARRGDLFLGSLSSILSHPFGNGFIDDQHACFITSILHAGGIFGILWVCLFGGLFATMVRHIVLAAYVEGSLKAPLFGLLAWFLVGIMYNTLHMGLMWGWFAILVALSHDLHTIAFRTAVPGAGAGAQSRTGTFSSVSET